ncbi:MAG: ComEC/Rec2 family competence protein, partial [Chloroflexi bacterium]|nr:ComEC/Rec2 family competence protein [Chloroflexota bacterium]
DYREHLARQGVQALMSRPGVTLLGEGKGWPHYALAYRVRRALSGGLARSLPEPQAALAQAILLGARAAIPEDVEQAFLDTGTTHLLAISGMNMAMALGAALPFSVFLLGRRSRLYLALPLALLWAYAFVSGLSPSVVRAALMASVYLGAMALGRPYAALPSIGVAAALMTAQRPALLYDLSFQLSFTSLAGIILLWRPIAAALERLASGPLRVGRLPGRLRAWAIEGTAVSIAAVAATAPLLVFTFGRVSLLSVPATLLALPALPAIMAASFATGAASLAAPVLGQVTGWAAWVPVSYMLWVVEGMAKLPFGMVQLGGFTGLLAWASYVALALMLLLFSGGVKRLGGWFAKRDATQAAPDTVRSLPLSQTAGVLSLALAGYLAWTAAATLPDGRLHVTILDVGQGDAILIQTPEGHHVLVDGGPSPALLGEKLGERMPFWDRSLELVALSHYHEDHLAGLVEALERYNVATVLDNPLRQEGSLAAQWRAAARAEGATLLEARAGMEVRMGDGVTVKTLWPPATLLGSGEEAVNYNSTVLRLQYGDFSLLLPGDLAQEGEAVMVDGGAGVRSSALKVGHHGSATSSGSSFLAAVRPLVAVVSVGAGNPYGHPSAEATGRIGAIVGEGRLLTTAERGDIELVTDGRSLWVRTER